MKKIWAIALIAVFVSGCASNPPLNFSVPNVGVSTNKLDAELRSLTVTLARPDEAKGKIPAAAQHEVPQMWESAMTEALNRMAIFRDDAATKVSLSVKILALDIPAFGASMTTKTIARYEIIDRSNGSIIYTQDVSAEGVVPFDYAFVGAIRARESISRSAQNNIAQFLQALETVDIAKPMFPQHPGHTVRAFTCGLLALMLAGCAPNVRTDSYSIGSVGQVNRTVAGSIISVRPVRIDGTTGGGAFAGGAAGGVAGSTLGGSSEAAAIGAIGGIVVGAIAGAAVERNVSNATGLEYVVQTENGNLMTVVQGPEPVFPVGSAVLVLYGSPSRVIADPRAAR